MYFTELLLWLVHEILNGTYYQIKQSKLLELLSSEIRECALNNIQCNRFFDEQHVDLGSVQRYVVKCRQTYYNLTTKIAFRCVLCAFMLQNASMKLQLWRYLAQAQSMRIFSFYHAHNNEILFCDAIKQIYESATQLNNPSFQVHLQHFVL